MAEYGDGFLVDVLSADQFTANHINLINNRADQFLNKRDPELASAGEGLAQNYRDLGRTGILATYFWFDEPSTRTVGSFDAARALLGMERLGHTNAKQASSTAKGETLRDSMRTANEHLKLFGGGVVVIRHPDEGSAVEAAKIMDFPVINAGDGQNEHPTQALLDIYTIKQRHGRLDDLHIVMGGDPRYSRTIHSLAIQASLGENIEITFIGEEDDWLTGTRTKEILDERGVKYSTTTELDPLNQADVVYWTRQQTERLAVKDVRDEENYAKKFAITEKILGTIPKHASIMHPLPRGPEMPESIDGDPRVAYWDQVRNGVPVRAALMEMVLRNYYIVRANEG